MNNAKEQAKYALEQKVRAVVNYATTDMMDTLLMVKGKQRLTDEQKQEYIRAGKRLLDLASDMVREGERRIRGGEDEPEQKPQEKSYAEAGISADTKWTVLESGAAYRGSVNDVVYVKVSMRPYLHESMRGSWSWRTAVEGHEGYRHISVSKLHSVVQDPSDGSIYVGVDSTWHTDQPVFKDVCNKPSPAGFTHVTQGTNVPVNQIWHSDNRWP